jgi:hypothetical protein
MEQFQTLASEFDGVAPLGNRWQVIWNISNHWHVNFPGWHILANWWQVIFNHWRVKLMGWHLWAIDGKQYGTFPNTGKWIWWGGTSGQLMASNMEHFQTLVNAFDCVAPLGNWSQVIWNISKHWQVNLMGWHPLAIDGK